MTKPAILQPGMYEIGIVTRGKLAATLDAAFAGDQEAQQIADCCGELITLSRANPPECLLCKRRTSISGHPQSTQSLGAVIWLRSAMYAPASSPSFGFLVCDPCVAGRPGDELKRSIQQEMELNCGVIRTHDPVHFSTETGHG